MDLRQKHQSDCQRELRLLLLVYWGGIIAIGSVQENNNTSPAAIMRELFFIHTLLFIRIAYGRGLSKKILHRFQIRNSDECKTILHDNSQCTDQLDPCKGKLCCLCFENLIVMIIMAERLRVIIEIGSNDARII